MDDKDFIERPCSVPIEDRRRRALKEYDEMCDAMCWSNSFIRDAIKFWDGRRPAPEVEVVEF